MATPTLLWPKLVAGSRLWFRHAPLRPYRGVGFGDGFGADVYEGDGYGDGFGDMDGDGGVVILPTGVGNWGNPEEGNGWSPL